MSHGRRSTGICIVGAGPVGGVLACRLAASGISVTVIDRLALPPMEHPEFDGRAFAIAAGSRSLLEQAGIWAALPLTPGPINDIRVSDGKVGRRASRLHLHFHQSDVGTGPVGWMVEARSLRVAVNACLHGSAAIDIVAPSQVLVERRKTHVLVHVKNGQSFEAQLVIAADGRDSRLRDEAGIQVTRLSYGQIGIVSAIAHEHPHHQTALEHFLPGGPFAQLPMSASDGEANLSAIVWTERAAVAERIMMSSEAIFAREIQRRLGAHLGAVRPVGRRWSYPLGALHAHRYVAERLALVGDAAHGIHPIAGQGLNLGLRDAAALSELLILASAQGRDLGDVTMLDRYQAQRRSDNMKTLITTDALDRLFSNDAPALRTIRGRGIAVVNKVVTVKRMLMNTAMGEGGASHG